MSAPSLQVGDAAPDFQLYSIDGTLVRLYEVLTSRSAVLTFYLKAFTPVCHAQVCGFRDAAEDFQLQGAALFGISSDSLALSRRFAESEKLPYPLLVDEHGLVRAAYRIPKLFGLLPGRATFLVSRDARIQHIANSPFNGKAHAAAILSST